MRIHRPYSSRQLLFRITIFLGLFLPQLLAAQEINPEIPPDTVLKRPKSALELMLPPAPKERVLQAPSLLPPKQQTTKLPDYSFKNELHIPYYMDPTPLHRGDYSTSGVIWGGRRWAIVGAGEQTTVPGIGRFNEAAIGYQQIFNNHFSMQITATAMKINRMNFVGEKLTASGRLNYRASDRVAFHMFGSYDITESYGMSTHSYGATMSVVMSDHFRMEMGAQRYYNTMMGKWETVPIVIPTYRFDNGFELGLDVGGIVYEILRSTVFDNRSQNHGPTIAPPRLNMPMR